MNQPQIVKEYSVLEHFMSFCEFWVKVYININNLPLILPMVHGDLLKISNFYHEERMDILILI